MKKIKLGLSLLLATSLFAVKSQAQVTLPDRTITRIDNTVGIPGYTSKPVTIALTGKIATMTVQVGSHEFTYSGEPFNYSGSFSNITFKATVEGVTSLPHPLPTAINQSETITAGELPSPTLHGGYGIVITCTGANQYKMTPTFFSLP